jgi:Fur family ferric uptake transcriptional regulator
MSTPLDLLQKNLRKQNYSLTAARQSVFSALLNKEPQTMQQLVTACPGIDRASVYRTVKLFETLGIIQRLQMGWKYKLELSDRFHGHHHHMTCLKCGKVISFDENVSIETRLNEAAAAHGFYMSEHQLEIQGICHECSKKGKEQLA